MKKFLSLLLVLGSAAVASAQGSFNGNTSTADPGDGSAGTIYDGTIVDNSTFTHFAYAGGSGYQAQYYIGTPTTDSSTLSPMGSSGSLASGNLAGYYQPGQISTSSAFSAGQQVTVQLRAWKGTSGTSYDNATLRGAGNLINITLSSALGAGPQFAPGQLSNIVLGTVVTPEPATIALGLMGASALLIRRRKV